MRYFRDQLGNWHSESGLGATLFAVPSGFNPSYRTFQNQWMQNQYGPNYNVIPHLGQPRCASGQKYYARTKGPLALANGECYFQPTDGSISGFCVGPCKSGQPAQVPGTPGVPACPSGYAYRAVLPSGQFASINCVSGYQLDVLPGHAGCVRCVAVNAPPPKPKSCPPGYAQPGSLNCTYGKNSEPGCTSPYLNCCEKCVVPGGGRATITSPCANGQRYYGAGAPAIRGHDECTYQTIDGSTGICIGPCAA